MPRQTSDPKEMTLKVRLNESMRNYVERKSNLLGITMSEYIRELIKQDMIK